MQPHDPLTVRWAHGVNTLNSLRGTLVQGQASAIESDFTWNSVLGLAVVRHAAHSMEPNAAHETRADAWVRELFQHIRQRSATQRESATTLQSVAQGTRRIDILKIDFKNLRAVKPTIEVLLAEMDSIELEEDKPEVWLNADILDGPGAGAGSPVEPRAFLRACRALDNRVLRWSLSLGWRTGWGVLSVEDYTHEHIDRMLALVNDPTLVSPLCSITYPIRASLARSSWAVISRLLDPASYAITDSDAPRLTSLTLWTAMEGCPQGDLDWIVRQATSSVGAPVYLDVDKGSKHAAFHPARLFLYAWHGMWMTAQ